MKIITKEGLKFFQKKHNAKLAYGNEKTWKVRFYIENKKDLERILNEMRGKRIQYGLHENTLTLSQEDLGKILPKEYFIERRVWFGADKMFFCSEMEHQHLSNTMGYLELILELGKITKPKAEEYLKKIQETIIPELEERFNGEILPYKPQFDWEFKLIKELENKNKK